jgi:DNA-binding IclR family transcriptional regulator
MRTLAVLIALCGATTRDVHAEGLIDEVMLHPLDSFTADTLPAGTVVYNQSPLTLPLPSWAWIGVTDWLTAEIDLLPLLGGFVIEPHVPVPSLNVRIRLLDGRTHRIGLALEVMGQHLWRSHDQESGMLRVTRKGTTLWARVNASIPLARRLRAHLSAGATWAHSIEYAHTDEPGTVYQDLVSPDASVAVDWRAHRRLSLHATGSYGTTFVYSDNQPRKWELAYGLRVAPFLDSGWRFARTFRVELAAIVTQYADLQTGYRLYVPLLPYMYWQFDPF